MTPILSLLKLMGPYANRFQVTCSDTPSFDIPARPPTSPFPETALADQIGLHDPLSIDMHAGLKISLTD